MQRKALPSLQINSVNPKAVVKTRLISKLYCFSICKTVLERFPYDRNTVICTSSLTREGRHLIQFSYNRIFQTPLELCTQYHTCDEQQELQTEFWQLHKLERYYYFKFKSLGEESPHFQAVILKAKFCIFRFLPQHHLLKKPKLWWVKSMYFFPYKYMVEDSKLHKLISCI